MSTNARPLIAGVGASAGGVEALEAFFSGMPADTGIAFIVVTHLDPKRESMLAEIIARRTAMPVATASDGDEVEAQRVYVAPPSATLTIEGGRLRLRPAEHREPAPIDIFFASLAEDQQDRAIGVVLSGAGDGTLGITAIKAHGRRRSICRPRDRARRA
jgi:two-component system CheB/CheR fusion protein